MKAPKVPGQKDMFAPVLPRVPGQFSRSPVGSAPMVHNFGGQNPENRLKRHEWAFPAKMTVLQDQYLRNFKKNQFKI